MSEETPVTPEPFILHKPKGPVPEVFKGKQGRKPGCKNYGGISLIAREFKAQGLDWKAEMVKAYRLFEAAEIDTPAYEKAKRRLDYWQEALPYIAIKMELKNWRGPKPQAKPRKTTTAQALKALEQMEAR